MNQHPSIPDIVRRPRGTAFPGFPPFLADIDLRVTFQPRPDIRLIVFDFDGTLSWLRHGWPEIMVDVFREEYRAGPDETAESVHNLLLNLILSLNGKPTIFQTMAFAELIQKRDGRSLDPETLRQTYQHRLDKEIAARSALIRSGKGTADDFVVYAARPLLEQLRQADVTLAILSSTVIERVREEAELLELTPYFGPHIYGGVGDPTKFSKQAVFERLLMELSLRGDQLLSFGDGPVEIQNTKSLGGTAIAVCSDENVNGSGAFDEFKRQQLLDAGADAAIPDYRDAGTLMKFLRS